MGCSQHRVCEDADEPGEHTSPPPDCAYRANVRTLIRRRRPRARAETATPPPSLATRFACRRSEPYRERARLLANALPVAIPPPHACNTTTVDPAPRADATLADLTPPPPPPQPPLRGARCGFSAAATPVEATPVEAPPLTPESCDRRRLGAILVACPPHCVRRRRWSRRAVRRCPAS